MRKMTRRRFLGKSGLGLAGMALLRPTASSAKEDEVSEKAPRWKPAIGLNGFMSSARAYGKHYPIREVLDFAAREGFKGVELVGGWPDRRGYPAPDEKERIAALKGLYDRYGLKIFAIQSNPRGNPLGPTKEVMNEYVGNFRRQAEFAAAVGAEIIGVWPPPPHRGVTTEQALENLIGTYRRATDIATACDLTVTVECEPPFVVNTSELFLGLLDGVGKKSFKAIFDPSHFDLLTGGKGHPETLLKRIGVERIGHIHLTDTDGTIRRMGRGGTSKHLPCGEGHVDIRKQLKILWDGGYRGWAMIDAWQIPDVYDACRKGKKAIEDALAAFSRAGLAAQRDR